MKLFLSLLLLSSGIFAEPNFKKIYLFGEITDESAKIIVSTIMECDKNFLLFINSPGGSVDAGNSIINAMQWCERDVHTIANGAVYSMAFHIFLYGKKRFAMPNSVFMFHDTKYDLSSYSLVDIEDFFEIEREQRELLNRDVVKKTKIPNKVIYKYVKEKRDFYLNTSKCLNYRIINKVITKENELF